MSINNVNEKLTKLGLTESEVKIYMAMLKIGASTVQAIAKEARLSRTAVYQILAVLENKGLVSTFHQKKKKLMVAEDPEKLEGYFSQYIGNMQNELHGLSRIIPELRAIQSGDMKPRVRFYRGTEAVRALFRDLAAVNPDELLEITNVDAVYSGIDSKILLEERAKFANSPMKVKVLRRGSPHAPSDKAEYRDIPHKTLNFQGDIWIYGDRLAFTHFVNDIETVIIDNILFADTMRALFLVIWGCAADCLARKK